MRGGGERDRACVGRNMIAVKLVCLALPNVTASPLPPHPPHTASVGGKRGGGAGEEGKGKITENGRQTYKKKKYVPASLRHLSSSRLAQTLYNARTMEKIKLTLTTTVYNTLTRH